MVRRCAASNAAPWLDAAAAQPGYDGRRAGGNRVVTLQRAVRPGAAARRNAASDAAPWRDAVAGEPDGTQVRPAAPLPGAARDELRRVAAQDGPWRAAVPQVGPPPQAAPALSAPGRTSRRSPRSGRHQEKTLQSQRRAEA